MVAALSKCCRKRSAGRRTLRFGQPAQPEIGLGLYWPPPLPALPPLAASQTETYRFGDGAVLLVRSIVFGGKPTGIIYIQSGLQGLYGRLKLYVGISAIVLAVSLLAALLISPVFQREIASPIHSSPIQSESSLNERLRQLRRAPVVLVLILLNLLAFACHTVCELGDKAWRAARRELVTRQGFFQNLRTITTYLVFPSWDHLLETMAFIRPPPLGP